MKVYRIRIGYLYAEKVSSYTDEIYLDADGRVFLSKKAVKLHISHYKHAYEKIPIYHIEEYDLNASEYEVVDGKRTNWEYGRSNEWICEHGVGHYDARAKYTVHGCCHEGCCGKPDFPGKHLK